MKVVLDFLAKHFKNVYRFFEMKNCYDYRLLFSDWIRKAEIKSPSYLFKVMSTFLQLLYMYPNPDFNFCCIIQQQNCSYETRR